MNEPPSAFGQKEFPVEKQVREVKRRKKRKESQRALCIPSVGDSRRTFHSHDKPGLSGPQRGHFLCCCSLTLSKNEAPTCLILTSTFLSPSPSDMPN